MSEKNIIEFLLIIVNIILVGLYQFSWCNFGVGL